MQTGQDDVGEPEGDEDDAGDPLPCFGTTQFRFAEETDVATNQNDDDGYHGADGIQHHGEAQRACWNVESLALEGKKQTLTVALLDERIVSCLKRSKENLVRRVDRMSASP